MPGPALEAFLASARVAGVQDPADAPSLEVALESAISAAREAWPGIDVPVLWFASLLGTHARAADVAALGELPVNDLWLASACARGDAKALRELEGRTFARARAELGRMRLSDDEIAEALQVLRERLFVAAPGEEPKILRVALHGDLPGIIRVAAVRTALNLKRRDARHEAVDGALFDAIASDEDPELSYLKRDQRSLFKACLEEALAGLEPKERNVLRLHLVHELSIDEIGRAYRVHRATAARWLVATREKLDGELRRLAREKVGVTEPEFESMRRLVDSGFYLSFRRLLASSTG